MDSLVARQFQMSVIKDDYVNKFYERVHSFEKRNKRLMSPYEIHQKCRIHDHGDISDEVQNRVSPAIWAIYNKLAEDMHDLVKQGEAYDEITLIHWVDDAVKDAKLDFSGKKNSQVYQRLKKGMSSGHDAGSDNQ